jgi:hypothetical protein
MSWRDQLKVHPAADLFPLMSEDELRELGEDIKANGLLSPIIIDGDDDSLVDGRNRLDAIELLGMEFEFFHAIRGPRKGKIIGIDSYDFETPGSGAVRTMYDFETNPYDFVISANLHRRHLTADQKRELIAKVLKAKPEASNRQIDKQVKADDKTVASVRRDLESVAEIPHLEKTVGADGKQYKSRKKAPEPAPMEAESATARAIGGAEISIEQRRAEMARLDQPDEDQDDIVERALSAIAAMDDQQRRRFHARYTELYGAVIETAHDVETGSEHEIPADLSIPEFMRRVPA